MTREEAIRHLNTYSTTNGSGQTSQAQHEEANGKALEKEPDGDLISRQAVIEAIEDDNRNGLYSCFASDNDAQCFKEVIRKLPPVNPQEPKTGHWIKSRDSYGNNHFTCPFCEHDIATKYAGTWKDNYCSNCGAKMVEPQESEEE